MQYAERLALDRRRLEATHLRYAVLQVASYYPNDFGMTTRIYPDLKVTLEYITPLFFSLFRSNYSGKYITTHIAIVIVSHFFL